MHRGTAAVAGIAARAWRRAERELRASINSDLQEIDYMDEKDQKIEILARAFDIACAVAADAMRQGLRSSAATKELIRQSVIEGLAKSYDSETLSSLDEQQRSCSPVAKQRDPWWQRPAPA